MIFGSIGYTILNNSTLFPNINILLLYDSHDEQIKKCPDDNIDIQINDYLLELLNKKYFVMIEEVPLEKDKKLLVELWSDSNHVKNTRKFYLDNKDNKNLLGFDIRFQLIDSFDESDYNDKTLRNYLIKIYEFFMLEHPYFKDILLYAKTIDKSFIKMYYTDILLKFRNLIIPNKEVLNIKIKNLPNKYFIINDINNILSDIMELYILIKLFDIIQINNNIVIYGGLIHIDNIKKLLIKYYKFNIKEEFGITQFNEHTNCDKIQCIYKPIF